MTEIFVTNGSAVRIYRLDWRAAGRKAARWANRATNVVLAAGSVYVAWVICQAIWRMP